MGAWAILEKDSDIHLLFMLFSSSSFIHLLLPSSSYPWFPMVVSFFLTHLLLEVTFIFLLLHSVAIKINEAKDSIDEEDPRPTSSNGATPSSTCIPTKS